MVAQGPSLITCVQHEPSKFKAVDTLGQASHENTCRLHFVDLTVVFNKQTTERT